MPRPFLLRRLFASGEIDAARFETEAIRTLEKVLEAVETVDNSDSSNNLNEGVLKVEFPEGTFIMNKHSITKQIWYSSPVIGPAYFEAITAAGNKWYSVKLEKDLYQQFAEDVQKLTGLKIRFP